MSPHWLNTRSILLCTPPILVSTDTEPHQADIILQPTTEPVINPPGPGFLPRTPVVLLDTLLSGSQQPPSYPAHSLYSASCTHHCLGSPMITFIGPSGTWYPTSQPLKKMIVNGKTPVTEHILGTVLRTLHEIIQFILPSALLKYVLSFFHFY